MSSMTNRYSQTVTVGTVSTKPDLTHELTRELTFADESHWQAT